MIRPALSRRTAIGGIAVAATTALALTTMSAASAAPAGRAAQTGPASDISLAIVQESSVLSGSSGPYVLALLHNPAVVPAGPSIAFAAAAYNAAGALVGAVKPSVVNHLAIAPGANQIYAFPVPAGTVRVGLTNPSGAAAPEIANPVGQTGPFTSTTDSSGFTTVSGTLSNPTSLPQQADVTLVEENAAGQILGADGDGSTTPVVIPAGGSAAFSDFLSPSQTAGVTQFVPIVNGTPDFSVATSLPIPSAQDPLVLGAVDTIHGFLDTSSGASASGRTVQFVARTNGVPNVLATTTTGAEGAYTFKVKLPGNAEFSVVHPTDASTFGTSSGDFFYPLTPVLTVSHLKAKTITAKKHKDFQISGTFPGGPGEKVYLELRNAKGKYAVVTFTRASGSGAFTFKGNKLKQSKAGKYTYRVEVQASGLHKDISSTFTVKVS